MVFNVTKQQIVARMAVVSQDTWPNKEFHDEGFKKLPRGDRLVMSSWLSETMLFPKK